MLHILVKITFNVILVWYPDCWKWYEEVSVQYCMSQQEEARRQATYVFHTVVVVKVEVAVTAAKEEEESEGEGQWSTSLEEGAPVCFVTVNNILLPLLDIIK